MKCKRCKKEFTDEKWQKRTVTVLMAPNCPPDVLGIMDGYICDDCFEEITTDEVE